MPSHCYKSWLCLLYLGMGLLVSCQKTIQIDLENYESKIVVYSENERDSLPEVYLSETQSYFGYQEVQNRYQFLKDASVSIRDEDGDIQTLIPTIRYDSIPSWMGNERDSVEIYYYKGTKPLTTAKTYKLVVSHKNREVDAEMQIPTPVQIKELMEEEISDPFNGESYKQYSIKFDDAKGSKDYYRVGVIIESYYTNWNPDTGDTDTIRYFSSNLSVVSEITDGAELKAPVFSIYPFSSPQEKYKIFIQRLSYGLGNYMESVNAQSMNGSDPFTEPTILRSNIRNGIGAFGGYATSDTIYKEF